MRGYIKSLTFYTKFFIVFFTLLGIVGMLLGADKGGVGVLFGMLIITISFINYRGHIKEDIEEVAPLTSYPTNNTSLKNNKTKEQGEFDK